MLDTIVLKGKGAFSFFKPEYQKGEYYKHSNTGRTTIPYVEVMKKDHYRAHYFPPYDMMKVELNPHKLVFNENIYNYENNPAVLRDFIARIGAAFFRGNSFFVDRIDIGCLQTFSSVYEADQALESYRNARFRNARVIKFKHQNYHKSVWYKFEHYIVKIYNKGAQMKIPEDIDFSTGKQARSSPPEVNGHDASYLNRTLRFEIGYDSYTLDRIQKTERTPYFGTPFKDLDVAALLTDFFTLFRRWERNTHTSFIIDVPGAMGAIALFDRQGKYAEIEASGIYSKSTLHRYRKLKEQSLIDAEIDTGFKPDFNKNNLQEFARKRWDYCNFVPFTTFLN